MSGQHTPGPWRVGKAVNGNWIEAGHAVQPVTVARTIYEHVGASVEDANAHLIAAAPCLLTFAESLADRDDSIGDDARTAIARARGEQA